LSDPAFKVNLPKARTQEGEEKEKITVSISDREKYSVNEAVFKTKDELFSGLKKALRTSDLKLVVIKADKNAGYGILTDVMAKAKDAGAVNITIATEQLKKVN
jgi:biopolymer transport protein ExbD